MPENPKCKIWLKKTYRYLKEQLIVGDEGYGFSIPRLDELLIKNECEPDELIELTDTEITLLSKHLIILDPTTRIKFSNLIYGPLTQTSGAFGISSAALLLFKVTVSMAVSYSVGSIFGLLICGYVAQRTFSEEKAEHEKLQADLFDSQIKLSFALANYASAAIAHRRELHHRENTSASLTASSATTRSNNQSESSTIQLMPIVRQPPKVAASSFSPPPKPSPVRVSRSTGRATGYFCSLLAFAYTVASIKAGTFIGALTLISVLGPVGFGCAIGAIFCFSVCMAVMHHQELKRINEVKSTITDNYQQALQYEQNADRLNQETRNLRQARQEPQESKESKAESTLVMQPKQPIMQPAVYPSPLTPQKQTKGEKALSFIRKLLSCGTQANDGETAAQQVPRTSPPTAQVR